MTQDIRDRLEALPGWSWNSIDDQWEEGFSHIEEYAQQKGQARVPNSYTAPDGYTLGVWVAGQRSKKDRLSPDRRDRLEALPGWSWNPIADQWEEGFRHLEDFVRQEGNARVPQSFIAPDGYRLGVWVNKQRSKKDRLPQDIRDRMEALPGWAWRLRDHNDSIK